MDNDPLVYYRKASKYLYYFDIN